MGDCQSNKTINQFRTVSAGVPVTSGCMTAFVTQVNGSLQADAAGLACAKGRTATGINACETLQT